MTDQWTEARLAAARAICVSAGCDPDDVTPENGGGDWPLGYLDAALSALREQGYVVVPERPWPSMIDAGSDELDRHVFPEVWAGETYEAMIAHFLKHKDGQP